MSVSALHRVPDSDEVLTVGDIEDLKSDLRTVLAQVHLLGEAVARLEEGARHRHEMMASEGQRLTRLAQRVTDVERTAEHAKTTASIARGLFIGAISLLGVATGFLALYKG